MKYRTLFLAILAFNPSSCTFNVERGRNAATSEASGEWRNQGWRPDSRTPPGWIAERNFSNCPMYIPPDKRVLPGAPLDEYKTLKRGEDREELLLKYIEQLRYHIKDVNTDNVDQYMKYLQACMGQSKQK